MKKKKFRAYDGGVFVVFGQRIERVRTSSSDLSTFKEIAGDDRITCRVQRQLDTIRQWNSMRVKVIRALLLREKLLTN